MRDIILAHERDIAWLIELWLAIHGGDPVEGAIQIDEVTALMAAALSARLTEVHGLGEISVEDLERRLGAAGVTVHREVQILAAAA